MTSSFFGKVKMTKVFWIIVLKHIWKILLFCGSRFRPFPVCLWRFEPKYFLSNSNLHGFYWNCFCFHFKLLTDSNRSRPCIVETRGPSPLGDFSCALFSLCWKCRVLKGLALGECWLIICRTILTEALSASSTGLALWWVLLIETWKTERNKRSLRTCVSDSLFVYYS